MASTFSLIDFVIEQLNNCGFKASYKKMFGEYGIFVDNKCIFLVCNDTVFSKCLDELSVFYTNLNLDSPYKGAKPHYIVDIEDIEVLKKIVPIILDNTKVRIKKEKVKN
jgi:TfoX/Sxy family transcriptional regulator of competence genes